MGPYQHGATGRRGDQVCVPQPEWGGYCSPGQPLGKQPGTARPEGHRFLSGLPLEP